MPIPASRMAEGKGDSLAVRREATHVPDDEGDAIVSVEKKNEIKVSENKPVGIARQNCPICRHKDRKMIEEGIIKGDLTKKTVSEDLGISVEDVYDHMMNHLHGHILMTAEDRPKKLRELYNKKDILMTSFIQLSERLNVFMANDKFEASDTNQIIRQTEELRKLSETLAKLEGELKSENTYTLNMYVDLRNVVIGLLCDDCRKRVIEELSKTERAMHTIDLTGVGK